MKRHRTRLIPRLTPLEGRVLLASNPSAAWLGQDGHDLAGGAQPAAGNGVQDVHILLSNVPAGRQIRSISVVGDGGPGWVYNIGPYYAATSGALVRGAGATTADLYVDPYRVETGRGFTLTLNYDDQSTATVTMQGGAADPNLRMPAFAVAAGWVGQDGRDLTGPTPAVGPDGHQDVHLTLAHLFPNTPVAAVTVIDPSGRGWASGTNPALLRNAEFIPDAGDPSRGDLYFSPLSDLLGQTLSLTVTYADGKVDHTTLDGGRADPNLAAEAPPPAAVRWGTLQGSWLGQDGFTLVGPGDVHLRLTGIPAGRSVVLATVSDPAGLGWSYVKPGSGASAPDPSAAPLGFRPGSDPTQADLAFPPFRDETGATLTVTVLLDDGSTLAAHVDGDTCDPGLRRPDAAPTFVLAHPGDDLNDLANRFGRVRLVAGTYPMGQPLVLSHPVTITADPGVTLLFAQAASAPSWTAAIKVRASHVTLEGFAVRFAGPVRWTDGISYGPAIVGSSDNFDPWNGDPLVGLTFSRLDLQSPPASTSWEEAPRTFRLVSAASGTITDNLIKGGTTELTGGPWTVTGNTVLGTLPGTFSYCAFATHSSHDVTIAANTVAPTGPNGKTWRFLVMTQSGFNDTISGNTVVGVGPMDNDTVPDPNASEIILTEAYHLSFEGMTSSVSADGYLVQIPAPQGGPARVGDVLSILSGPQAGQWRRVAQVLSPTAYLLDAPVTPGSFAVSLATGFVNEMFLGNTIDARGSSTAQDMVLVGNHFGARVVGNHFLGGGVAFKITACPSETPVTWGWTHAPFLGGTIESNTIEDTWHGGTLDVEHNAQYIKSNAGRVYFSGSFSDNTGVWSTAFLAARAAAGLTDPPVLVTVGNDLSGDPGELVLAATGNTVQGPSSVVSGATFRVAAATVGGVAQRDVGVVLPAAGAPPAQHQAATVPVPSLVRPPVTAPAAATDRVAGAAPVAAKPAVLPVKHPAAVAPTRTLTPAPRYRVVVAPAVPPWWRPVVWQPPRFVRPVRSTTPASWLTALAWRSVPMPVLPRIRPGLGVLARWRFAGLSWWLSAR